MLGGINHYNRDQQMRRPRVHAGADEYFQRNREAQEMRAMAPPTRTLRGDKGGGGNELGGGKFMTYVYWLVGGLAVIALIYFAGYFLKTSGVSAKLVFQEGEVQVKRGPKGEWKTVETDTKLKKLDEIKTMEGARAIVSFEDGTMMRLAEFSRVILSGEKNKTIVIQTDGQSYHRVVKSENVAYEVEFSGIDGMPETKIESVGTAFWVEKRGTEVIAGVLEGQVRFVRESDTLDLGEGQRVTMSQGEMDQSEVALEDLRNDFISWNLDQDKKKELSISAYVRTKLASAEEEEPLEEEENQTETGEEEVGSGGEMGEGLVLTGEATTDGIRLNWELNGMDAPEGFKVVKGPNTDPEYPGSYYRSVKLASTRTYTWDVTDGKTHHFRVCVYDGSTGCSVYSNDLEIEAKEVDKSEAEATCKNSGGEWDETTEKCDCPEGEELENGRCTSDDSEEDCEDSGGSWDDDDDECDCPDGEDLENGRCVKEDYADSVNLKGSNKDKKTANLNWTLSGGGAPHGYKIVKSKSKNPTYPDDDYKTIKSESTKSYDWDDLKKGETYYFRVCVWDGDKCKVYSDNDKVEIDD